MNRWLCDLGHELSHYAYEDLSRAHRSAGRLQSSETGITHVLTRLMWATAEQHRRTHRIAVTEIGSADERRLGADMELWFTDGAVGLGWRIQAKRLYAPGGIASPPRFARLDHKVGRKLQATVLTDSTDFDRRCGAPIAALYWLYVFDPTGVACSASPRCRCGSPRACAGILAVGGHRVREWVLRRKQIVEPFSHHRWAHEGTALTDILCDAAAEPDPGGALNAVASSTAALGVELAPSENLPDYVVSLLADQPNDIPGDIQRDENPERVGSPNALITAVIDLRE